ncbi:U7 protein [macacine betaherpesvirus 9]|uniref:U7 protein n=1 Tax=macacine betaherpesvirus 9 TaxID=2560568 RepID=A0A192XNI0_9BETA|nr:U7 protein [macacine betaherpesvirus 9]ANC96516.1 U7 protein [macacine betaherpesvirus 9]
MMSGQYKTKPCIGKINNEILSEFKELCRTHNFDGINLFIQKNHNLCLALIWPRNLWLKFVFPSEIVGYSENQFTELNDHYQGFTEKLCLIGSIQITKKEIPIFVGMSSRIFCHDLETDILYVIAEDFEKFVKFGVLGTNVITSSEPIYTKYYYDGPKLEKSEILERLGLLEEGRHLNTNIKFNRKTALLLKTLRKNYLSMLYEFDELARCKNLFEVQKFVSLNKGLKIRLETPIFTCLILEERENIHCSVSEQRRFEEQECLFENVAVLGYLSISEDDPGLKPILCIGASGAIYYYDWIDNVLTKIADCLLTFARVGFARYCGDFGYDRIGKVTERFGRSSTFGSFPVLDPQHFLKIVPVCNDVCLDPVPELPPFDFNVDLLMSAYGEGMEIVHNGIKCCLVWPPEYVLSFGEFYHFGCKRSVITYDWSNLIGADEFLCAVGYAHPNHRKPNPNSDPFVMYCSSNKMFALDTITDELFIIAESPVHFCNVGLRNFPPFASIELDGEHDKLWYGETRCSGEEIILLQRNVPSLQHFVTRNCGQKIRIDAFQNFDLSFCSSDDIHHVTGSGVLEKIVKRDYVVLGTCARCQVEPNCRAVILIGPNYHIYVYADNKINKVAKSIREFIRRGFDELVYKEKYSLTWNDDSLFYLSESEAENLNRMLNGESPLLRKKPRHMYPRPDRLLKNMSKILFAVHPSELNNFWIQRITKFLHPIIVPRKDTEMKYIVPLSESRLRNGIQATAAERFGIKGLKLCSDSVLWNKLIDYEYEMFKYPSTFMRADRFISLIQDLKFMDDFDPKWACITKLAAIGFYSGASLFNLGAKPGIGHWCRYLCEYLSMLFFKLDNRLRELTKESKEKLGGFSCAFWSESFKIEMQNKTESFFRRDFLDRFQLYLLEHFLLFCGCEECRFNLFRFKNLGTMKKNLGCVKLHFFQALGKIDLPIFPHLAEQYSRNLVTFLARDLCLSFIEGQIERCKLPISINLNVTQDKKNLLNILSNIVFLLYVIQTLYSVLLTELKMYYDVYIDELKNLATSMEFEIKLGSKGCLNNVRYISMLNQVLDMIGNPGTSTNFIFNCLEAIKIGFEIPYYQNYDESKFLDSFYLHHLYIKRHGEKSVDLIAADNLAPGFFIVNAKERRFIDVLEKSILNIEAEYLSNTKNINGAMAIFFSGLKYFGNTGYGEIQVSPEKDVRAIGYKLGSLGKIQNDIYYFSNSDLSGNIVIESSDESE